MLQKQNKKTLGEPKVTGEKIVGKERGGRRRKRGKDAADDDSSRLMEMTVDRERPEDSRREADTDGGLEAHQTVSESIRRA